LPATVGMLYPPAQIMRTAFSLSPQDYTLTQLRYDLRKMKAHGLLERIDKHYAYRLTEKGTRVAAMFVLFHKRICGPPANNLFQHRPKRSPRPPLKSKLPTTRLMPRFKSSLISWLPDKI
jgi:hypothetical protein